MPLNEADVQAVPAKLVDPNIGKAGAGITFGQRNPSPA